MSAALSIPPGFLTELRPPGAAMVRQTNASFLIQHDLFNSHFNCIYELIRSYLCLQYCQICVRMIDKAVAVRHLSRSEDARFTFITALDRLKESVRLKLNPYPLSPQFVGPIKVHGFALPA